MQCGQDRLNWSKAVGQDLWKQVITTERLAGSCTTVSLVCTLRLSCSRCAGGILEGFQLPRNPAHGAHPSVPTQAPAATDAAALSSQQQQQHASGTAGGALSLSALL